jgi:hypothetical protein
MICALLVFQTAELPQPLGRLSPWVDWLGVPPHEVYDRLAGQDHQRFMKTHTPLDGIPLDPRATYIVVGRHPLDVAVSLYHQGDNIDRARLHQLTGQAAPVDRHLPRLPLPQWLRAWIDWQGEPGDNLDSLPGVLWHAADAWSRRLEPNVVLVHYDDLIADLDGEMRRLAGLLGITVPETTWADLVRAARFEEMRAQAQSTAPDPADILKDRARFFRLGVSGAGRKVLTSEELAHYETRVAGMAPPEVVAWLHHTSAPDPPVAPDPVP